MITDQQLYIDGVLMDIADNTSVTLDIKSNMFRDVSKMTSNRTFSIKLPKTVHNMRVLRLSGRPESGEAFPFVFHTARYCRNGLEIISDGRASLLNIGDDIEISIYWGLFPALTTLQSSGMKLNELKMSEYVLFGKDNDPDKYEDALSKGVFYADYDTARYRSATEEWTNYDEIQGGNDTNVYELSDGRIYTGTAVGGHISAEVETDTACRCANVPFHAGQTASVMDIVSSGDYRTWAVLDTSGNVLSLAEDGTAASDIIIKAPAAAARLVVNAVKVLSTGIIVIIDTITEITVNAAPARDGYRRVQSIKGTIQPCVSCERVLRQITADTGVRFAWSAEAEQDIKSLVIPLVTRKADARTLPGTLLAGFSEVSKLGTMTMNVSQAASSLFREKVGVANQLTAVIACSMSFDVQFMWSWDASLTTPSGYKYWQNADGTTVRDAVYQYPPCYVIMKVVSLHTSSQKEDEYAKNYIIGRPADEDSVKNTTTIDYASEMVDGRFIHLMAASGMIDIAEGDIITFELKHPKNMTLRGLKCYNGLLNISAKQSDEVPYGGNYPIGKNLPEITVLDFIKFLCVVTCSFPLQNLASGALRFARIQNAIDKSKAVDWTKKLIQSNGKNQPRQMDFSVEDFCRHNYYRWKEDDTVTGDYDADLRINNATLEYTQEKWTLPFAASDDNRVPIYEWKSESKTLGSGFVNQRTVTQYTATEYKACKDRIMNVYETSQGKAALRFGIDLQGVFDNDLVAFRTMISRPKQLTERFKLSDIDILNLDETKPIYLAQYGCYFVLLELKTTTKGYCEVQMLKID